MGKKYSTFFGSCLCENSKKDASFKCWNNPKVIGISGAPLKGIRFRATRVARVQIQQTHGFSHVSESKCERQICFHTCGQLMMMMMMMMIIIIIIIIIIIVITIIIIMIDD